jgi:hypothetical protein
MWRTKTGKNNVGITRFQAIFTQNINPLKFDFMKSHSMRTRWKCVYAAFLPFCYSSDIDNKLQNYLKITGTVEAAYYDHFGTRAF